MLTKESTFDEVGGGDDEIDFGSVELYCSRVSINF